MHFKNFTIIVLFIVLVIPAKAQSLRIYNLTDHTDISGSTIMIQSTDNHGWVGYESLDLYIQVENDGTSQMEIGAKKIEVDSMQPDVLHSICFAGECYAPSVFISVYHINLFPGQSDSGFVAHYLFDNQVHVRGQNNVVYVFYDANNPSDSVFVNVVYNTVVTTGINSNNINAQVLSWPNPANESINLRFSEGSNGYITNMQGENIMEFNFMSPAAEIQLNTTELSNGIYFYHLFDKSQKVSSGKFTVLH